MDPASKKRVVSLAIVGVLLVVLSAGATSDESTWEQPEIDFSQSDSAVLADALHQLQRWNHSRQVTIYVSNSSDPNFRILSQRSLELEPADRQFAAFVPTKANGSQVGYGNSHVTWVREAGNWITRERGGYFMGRFGYLEHGKPNPTSTSNTSARLRYTATGDGISYPLPLNDSAATVLVCITKSRPSHITKMEVTGKGEDGKTYNMVLHVRDFGTTKIQRPSSLPPISPEEAARILQDMLP
jgi:hypothetical protein